MRFQQIYLVVCPKYAVHKLLYFFSLSRFFGRFFFPFDGLALRFLLTGSFFGRLLYGFLSFLVGHGRLQRGVLGLGHRFLLLIAEVFLK